MNPVQHYVNKKTGKRYYFTSEDLFCESCDKLLSFVFLYISWGKKKSFAKKLCFECSQKVKQVQQYEEIPMLLVVKKKPKNSELVLITQPELKVSSKDDSVFSNTLESTYADNKAKRFGHSDYTVLDDNAPVLIGKSIDVKEEDEKNKMISCDEESDLLLDSFKNEKILIGNDKDEIKKLK